MPQNVTKAIPIMGCVGVGGSIDVEFEQVPPEGCERVDLEWSSSLIGFEVSGSSMAPRIRDGDTVLCEREPLLPVRKLVGTEAVVHTKEKGGVSRRMVKRIAYGSTRDRYNLESIDSDVPPIVDVRIAWASPVKMIILKR